MLLIWLLTDYTALVSDLCQPLVFLRQSFATDRVDLIVLTSSHQDLRIFRSILPMVFLGISSTHFTPPLNHL